MSLSRKNLAQVNHYSIDLNREDAYTYSVQISNLNDQKIVADLPLDAPDNTLAAALDENAIATLGNDAADVLETLSKALEKIGGKEVVVKPVGYNLPDYVPAEDHAFKRVRQANRADLEQSTSVLLAQHNDLVMALDEQLEFVVGMTDLSKKIKQPYHKVFDLLQVHANFTDGKMAEYKDEDIQGVKARFNNKNVASLAVLNKQHDLVGIMRCLAMGNRFGYLSDETLNQNILPLEKFSGETIEEQMKNRGQFLLAYFASKALSLIKNQDQFVIIAAAGREDIYDAIGFQSFPIKSNNYVVTMKFAKPGPELTSAKEELMKPFSNAEAISKLGVRPSPSPITETAVHEEEQQRVFSNK